MGICIRRGLWNRHSLKADFGDLMICLHMLSFEFVIIGLGRELITRHRRRP